MTARELSRFFDIDDQAGAPPAATARRWALGSGAKVMVQAKYKEERHQVVLERQLVSSACPVAATIEAARALCRDRSSCGTVRAHQ